MESMPFLHAGTIFTITFEDDLEFVEVRFILDHLLGLNAFHPEIQAEEGYYSLDYQNNAFRVWVSEMEVIIQRGSNLMT